MSRARTVAVFGGSFDPPHVGHLLAVTHVLATAEVDRVLVVPTFEHAFGKSLTPYPHRRRMTELALADLRRVEVSDIEARLGGASYTFRTLQSLIAERPGVALRLVIGSDLVAQIPSWREGERIGALAPLLVIGRGGHTDDAFSMPAVSSSEIRADLAAGRSVDARVPRAVARYIADNGLYTGAE